MIPDRTDPWAKLPSPQHIKKVFVLVLYIVGTILTCCGVYYSTIPQELKQRIPKPNGDHAPLETTIQTN